MIVHHETSRLKRQKALAGKPEVPAAIPAPEAEPKKATKKKKK